jgi:hypothetical protein
LLSVVDLRFSCSVIILDSIKRSDPTDDRHIRIDQKNKIQLILLAKRLDRTLSMFYLLGWSYLTDPNPIECQTQSMTTLRISEDWTSSRQLLGWTID